MPEAAVEALKKSFAKNAARCREKAAGKHPGVGNICTAEAVTWEKALTALDALNCKEKEESRRVPRGGKIRQVITQRGLVEMVPVSALLSDETKAALYEAHMRYQNVDPREQSEDGWAECILKAAMEQVGGSSTEGVAA